MKLKKIMKPREPIVENGTYLAVCVGVVFVGEQYMDRTAFGGRSSYENQVVFVWDLPSELDKDGKPKQLSKDLNATSSPNGTLNSIMEAWNSRTYSREELEEADLNDQLGKVCQLTVAVSESGYSNVKAVAALPKGIQVPATDTPHITFDVDEWDDTAFAALPEWVQEKIKKSTQYQKDHTPTGEVDFEKPAQAGPQTALAQAAAAPAGGCPI